MQGRGLDAGFRRSDGWVVKGGSSGWPDADHGVFSGWGYGVVFEGEASVAPGEEGLVGGVDFGGGDEALVVFAGAVGGSWRVGGLVQLGEDVVEEENGAVAAALFEELRLGESHG